MGTDGVAAGTTGVRIGECCRLLVGDVDVHRKRLRVRKSKAGKARDAPLTSRVIDMLGLAGRASSELLFVAPRGVVVSRGEDAGVYYARGGRGVLRVYSAGVMDAGGFVRRSMPLRKLVVKSSAVRVVVSQL